MQILLFRINTKNTTARFTPRNPKNHSSRHHRLKVTCAKTMMDEGNTKRGYTVRLGLLRGPSGF